jgi:phage-related protein (TIGR01555 family)
LIKRSNQNTHENLGSVVRSKAKLQRVKNMRITSAGAGGRGDRAAAASVPFYSNNPETFTNPLERWREYALMYQTSWEIRKIVNIPVDDALRKPPTLKGISDEAGTILKKKLDKLQWIPVTKRALKLERLLGGCLQFMGLEADNDDSSQPYHPTEGKKLLFMNSIPISRISRMNWSTDPLSASYMRPSSFYVNNIEVHVSRCLIWDGSPLFDCNDFALTNYRANLAGFGNSVIGCLFDDVVMACGTRQAAYQMVQMTGAIIATIDMLQEIGGTAPGQAKVKQLEQMINDLSVYRATFLAGDKVKVESFNQQFGSIPELLLMYLQVLSAASDIPASRFLGQAPGGLSTDDRSGLENYYNQIDAYQSERITPQFIRLCDVIGYAEIPNWENERKKLEIEWPPLWNETAKEEAERAGLTIANVLQLVDAALMGEEAAIGEINARGILATKLEKSDLELLQSAQDALSRHLDLPNSGSSLEGKTPSTNDSRDNPFNKQRDEEEDPGKRSFPGGTSGDQKSSLQRLKNMAKIQNDLSDFMLKHLVKEIDYDPDAFDLNEIKAGYVVEQEHADITKGEPEKVMRIVMAHMTEKKDYYSELEKMEHESEPVESK